MMRYLNLIAVSVACSALLATSSTVLSAADDPVDARKRKGIEPAVLEAAKKFAKSVARDDDEAYYRVLFSTLGVAQEAQRREIMQRLEREIEERQIVLEAIRSPKSRVIGGGPARGTPTLDRSRSVIKPSEPVGEPEPDEARDFAPRLALAGAADVRSSSRRPSASRSMSFFADREWQKNAMSLLNKTGGNLEPRIFNPNDDESRPVTDLLDCVSIGRPGQSCCTGTLIASNIVLTAAHCVPCGASHVYVGYNSNVPSTGALFAIKRIIPHPQYDQPTPSANDLAIVVLKQAIPSTLAKPRQLASTAEVRSAGIFTAVGFGNTDEGNFGIKLEAPVALRSLLRKELTAGGMGFDSCQGDSGGPLYFENSSGRFRLAGVTSRGGECGTGGIYVRVDAYASWIQEMVGANRP